MSQALHNREKLRHLIRRGFLPRSMCSAAFLKMLTPVLSTKIVAWQRSGAGRRLVVLDPETLIRFYRQLFPHAADELLLPSARVAGVAEFRDSKSLGSTGSEIVIVRAWCNGGLTRQGILVDLEASTRECGAFCFVLKPIPTFALRGKVALVENPAVFLDFEHLGADVPTAVFGHGRISDHLLDWLASQTDPSFELIHFGDYDPVGLDEFRRIESKCKKRAKLHFPPGLPTLFEKYSNRELVENPVAQRLLSSLRKSSNAMIREVVRLIDYHNGGLEQEALLIHNLT